MYTILVIDDAIFCREMVARTLRHESYNVLTAGGGQEGLDLLLKHPVHLILLDKEMPGMDGLEFLHQFSNHSQWRNIPVIMLTGVAEKDSILAARHLGVVEYILKSSFSAEQMLSRVRKHVMPHPLEPAAQVIPPSDPLPLPTQAITAAPLAPAPMPEVRRPVLSRDTVMAAIDHMEQLKTLAGVVQQALAFADSSRSSLPDLAALIQKDAVMSARVFQTANSASFTAARGRVTTIEEAIRNIGTGGLRRLAMSCGVIEALSQDGPNNLGLLRCWQHSLAVASVMDRIVENIKDIPAGIGHLVGLCHDLAAIILRQQFPDAYQAVELAAARDHVTAVTKWPTAFGISYAKLTSELMRRLQLPIQIAKPIEEFAASDGRSAGPGSVLARVLRVAEMHANGMLLLSDPETLLSPLEPADCRGLTGLPSSDASQKIRSEVLAASCAFARVSAKEEAAIMRPLLPAVAARVAYFKHPSLGPSDPVGAALQLLCQLECFDALPNSPDDWGRFDAIVIAGQHAAKGDIERIVTALPEICTLLIMRESSAAPTSLTHVTRLPYPFLLCDLHAFLERVANDTSIQFAAV